MAEAILRERYPRIAVRSAGVFASPGSPASGHTETVLEEIDIELHHRSEPVTDELLLWADLVLTMTEEHKRLLLMEFADYQEKVYTLKEYTGALDAASLSEPASLDISDPFGVELEMYRTTRDELEQQIELLKGKLEASEEES
jgi:protein-tyrosine phosphatase